MNSQPTAPVLAIESPPDNASVMPDFSVSGSCSNWSDGEITCDLQEYSVSRGLGKTPSQTQSLPLTVQAQVSRPDRSNAVTWEVNFSDIPPGEYKATVQFSSLSPPKNVAIDTVSRIYTVVDYYCTDFCIDKVLVVPPPASNLTVRQLSLHGKVPPGSKRPHGTCFVTFRGKRLPGDAPLEYNDPDQEDAWQATVNLPSKDEAPYTIHVQIEFEDKRYCLARMSGLILTLIGKT